MATNVFAWNSAIPGKQRTKSYSIKFDELLLDCANGKFGLLVKLALEIYISTCSLSVYGFAGTIESHGQLEQMVWCNFERVQVEFAETLEKWDTDRECEEKSGLYRRAFSSTCLSNSY